MAEGVGLHVGEQHAVRLALPRELLQGANGGGSFTGLAVRGPVVESSQRLGGCAHLPHVEGGWVFGMVLQKNSNA